MRRHPDRTSAVRSVLLTRLVFAFARRQGYTELAKSIRGKYADAKHTNIVLVCETSPEHVVLFAR